MKKGNCKCALCGQVHSDIELILPGGKAVCFKCARDICTAIYAIKALIKQET